MGWFLLIFPNISWGAPLNTFWEFLFFAGRGVHGSTIQLEENPADFKEFIEKNYINDRTEELTVTIRLRDSFFYLTKIEGSKTGTQLILNRRDKPYEIQEGDDPVVELLVKTETQGQLFFRGFQNAKLRFFIMGAVVLEIGGKE